MNRTGLLLIGLPLVMALSGCMSQPVAASTPEPSARQFIIVVDVSASRSTAMEADARQFLHGLAKKLSYGDQVVMLRTQENGLADQPKRWNVTMPAPKDPAYITHREKSYLESAQEGMEWDVEALFKPAAGSIVAHTDLLTTFHLAAESISSGEQSAPVTLLILSDMLQSAKGIEMENTARMPSPRWVSQQKRDGLLPGLDQACVIVIGADSTNAAGIKIKQFWQSYFRTAGASLLDRNYRATPPLPSRTICQ